jgi:hypothetical protein
VLDARFCFRINLAIARSEATKPFIMGIELGGRASDLILRNAAKRIAPRKDEGVFLLQDLPRLMRPV